MKSLLSFFCAALLGAVASVTSANAAASPAFPGAVGFGSDTPGGRGGQVIKVTNLNASGPGSFAAALQAKGPRIVVFEVGGVIDLNATVLRIAEPFVTVAGQTAPAPGITLIRGGVNIATHDVVLQHLRVRAGDVGRPKKSGWEVDSMGTIAAWNVVVDHCSLAWSTDENLSASGPRFDGGPTVDDWRKHTSHEVTFSHCIIAEGLSQSTHIKGEHSKGSLIHDNAQNISIIGNLYASNMERNPLFKGGVHGVVVNNLIDNPGNKTIHYNLLAPEWTTHPFVNGQMAVVGNVLQYGPDTKEGRPLVMVGGDGVLELFVADNITRDRAGQPVPDSAVMLTQSKTAAITPLRAAPLWPAGFQARPAGEVKADVLKHAGARPWDRDDVDQRIVRQVEEGKGKVIDSQEQVGGYPHPAMTTRHLDVPNGPNDAWLASFVPAEK
jgi:hypothetical protein